MYIQEGGGNLRFWKMNGAGNDFVILNNLEEHLPLEQLGDVYKRQVPAASAGMATKTGWPERRRLWRPRQASSPAGGSTSGCTASG